MAKKKSKMYSVNNNEPKNKNVMKLNVREIQFNLPGLNRNDGIVKTGTGKWENKRRKHIDNVHKREMSGYKSNSDISFFFLKK